MTRLGKIKVAIVAVIVLLIVAGIVLVYFTPHGQTIRNNPEKLGEDVRTWVHHHRVYAPLVYMALYIICGMIALPVWWLQVLAGYGFGLTLGIGYSTIAATICAGLTAHFSHFLAGDFVHEMETKRARLHTILDKVGHNGFVAVLLVRLTHLIPFGFSNYLFGIANIPPREVALGTLCGIVPGISFYIIAGSAHSKDWRAWAILVGINLLMLAPVLIFKRRRKPVPNVPSET